MVFKKDYKTWNKLNLNEEEIINLYVKKGLNTIQISKIFNCSQTPIVRVLKENNITLNINIKRFKKEEIIEIIRLYTKKELSMEKISKIFNCSQTPIERILKENNIKLRLKGFKKGHGSFLTKKSIEQFRERITGDGNPMKKLRVNRGSFKVGHKLSNESLEKIKKKLKGRKIWNTGLNEESDERVKRNIRLMKETKNSKEWKETKGKEAVKKIKKARAKQVFPIKDTSIEVKIQQFLKQLGIEFFTHQYMKEIEHGYQCDILIPSMNLVIECDGDYWHKYPIGREIDNTRTRELIEKGFKVLRLWEFEIRPMELIDFREKLRGLRK